MTKVIAILYVAIAMTLLSGCTTYSQRITPTPGVAKQIGIAIYPNAKPLQGQLTVQSSRVGGRDALSMEYTTTDHFDAVMRYYATHVPKTAKKMTIPLGFFTTVAYQWYDKQSLKQAIIGEIKARNGRRFTFITLQSVSYSLGHPTSSHAK
ncbi:MAG: hypothetical protein M3Z41_00485 [Candidatus Eremiobacteraeota bacterium]|nr:hypothetical protein [Candidatus Eremiobacteraeota bacterium]